MKIALAQLDLVVGDISGNLARIVAAIDEAESQGAQVAVFPELAITGYPPEDLVLKKSFLEAADRALDEVAAHAKRIAVVVGVVESEGDRLFNSAAVCSQGSVRGLYRKQLLPNYGVFDERRYFSEGSDHLLLATEEAMMGVTVCEDAWSEDGPVVTQGRAGAQIVISINASPFHKGKRAERERMLCARARQAEAAIVYVNLVGGQDELVFDGGSVVVDPEGTILARMPQFEEGVITVDVPAGSPETQDVAAPVDTVEITVEKGAQPGPPPMVSPLGPAAEVYEALRISVRDYATKNGFQKVLLGLSGGIDSSLCAAIAADALGGSNVLGVTMPSTFSTDHSVEDSEELASALGITFLNIPIGAIYDAYLSDLEDPFGETEMGLAEENLQARIRGAFLMTISNRYGHLVLATGNKSELAVGYATIYGDMVGGFAALRDVFKTEVYALARYRNSISPVIPDRVITKAPSAELRHDQRDEDSLPPYDVLDRILEGYIERDEGVRDLTAAGFEADLVKDVIALVDRAEYKRRQAAPGPKVTTKAFGRDRRLPITNRWRENA